jgi:hypothetical protein
MDGVWHRASVWIIVARGAGSGIVSVRLVGVHMGKRGHSIGIVDIRGRVVVGADGGRARERDFGTGVETSATGAVDGERMGVVAVVVVCVEFRPFDGLVCVELRIPSVKPFFLVTKIHTMVIVRIPFPGELPDEERDDSKQGDASCHRETNDGAGA